MFKGGHLALDKLKPWPVHHCFYGKIQRHIFGCNLYIYLYVCGVGGCSSGGFFYFTHLYSELYN